VTAVDWLEILMHMPVVMAAVQYFAILEVQKPDTNYPKHDAEVWHGPGKVAEGYALMDVLVWPMEVYKEVQVNKYILSVTYDNNLG
jgi:hypothetical protein